MSILSTICRAAREAGREGYAKDERFSTVIDWIQSEHDTDALDIMSGANEAYRQQAEKSYKDIRMQTNSIQFSLGTAAGMGLIILVWLVHELATGGVEFLSGTALLGMATVIVAFAIPIAVFTRLYRAAYALGVLEERQKEIEAINELFIEDFCRIKVIDLQATLERQREVIMRPDHVQQALAFLAYAYGGFGSQGQQA